MSDAPINAVEVARHLGALAVELDSLVKAINDEDRVATVLREEYLMAYASAWRSAIGSVESRKQIAINLTHEQRIAVEMADSMVRDYRRRIDALRVRIDVGRSYGAAVRAEIELGKTSFGT